MYQIVTIESYGNCETLRPDVSIYSKLLYFIISCWYCVNKHVIQETNCTDLIYK